MESLRGSSWCLLALLSTPKPPGLGIVGPADGGGDLVWLSAEA